MLNVKERQGQLNSMKVTELKELAKGYGIKVSGSKKAELIDNILMVEEEIHDEEYQAEMPTWWNLVVEMNMKDGNPHVYKSVKDRPLLQQILLHVVRNLYLDTKRATKVAEGKASKEEKFGPVFVAKNYDNEFRMKDKMAKFTVKSAAEKVLSKDKEQQKKFIVGGKFKQAVQILDKLDDADLIHGNDTDKEYAKFYTVYPDEMLAFLEAVGCLKK